MAVAEMGLGLNMLPMARNYPLLSMEVQQNGSDQLYDRTPRDQQQGQNPQQQQRQAQIAEANGGGVLRESGADDEAATLDAGSNVSTDSIRELEELLTKLNPMAKEFIPPSHADASSAALAASIPKQNSRRNGNNGGSKKRVNSRTSRAQREDSIRRTVYVSDIDQQVTEEQLAALFITCGQVVDCRVCGDPNSVLRFAFVEFTDEEGARAALSLGGTMLGYYPVRVLPSKTAIVPVNPTFLPRTEDDREMCARTIYCTNIDKKVSQADVKLFFESLCGEMECAGCTTKIAGGLPSFYTNCVCRVCDGADEVRGESWTLVIATHDEGDGDNLMTVTCKVKSVWTHSSQSLLVKMEVMVSAESAMAALNCSGAILGSLPIRVSPSKTPVRPRSPRPPLH